MNRAALAQQQETVDTEKRIGGVDDYMCSAISTSRITKTMENADQVADALRKARNAAYFANSEKGLTQFQNELYELMVSLPPERVDIGELFLNPSIPVSGQVATNLDYLNKLLFDRVPVHLLKDLRENADTATKNTLVSADRIAAESRIGSTLMSMLQGMHSQTDGVGAAESLKQIMTANTYSPQYTEKLLGGGKPSKYGVLKALTVGQIGQKFVEDRTIAKPENVQSGIMFQLMINNMLLFEQYNLLETIAMSTAANVIANREEAIKDVNALVQNKNAR